MDWSKGYSATYYMTRVDPITWRDIGIVNLTGGSISRERTGLMESADIDCIGYEDGEQWIRVYLDVRQGGAAAHEPLFTGLATSPDDEIDGTRVENALQCYSVLKPAEDVLLLRGWYAPRGVSGTTIIKQLLASSPAPIVVEDGAPYLTEAIIAEEGESCLSMAQKVLAAINWRIRIGGDGTISLEPQATDPVAVLDPLSNDVIEPGIKVSNDWYGCPNVFLAIEDDLTAIARDDSVNSALSTVNRGREVWMKEDGCDLADGETIAEYANRRLKEEQQYEQTASYDRRYLPETRPGDLIRLRYPEQGLDGVYQISSQKIDLGYAAKTSEEVIGAVKRTPKKKPKPVETNLYVIDDDVAMFLLVDEDENPIAIYDDPNGGDIWTDP